MRGRRLAVLGGCGGIGRGLVMAALQEDYAVAVLDLPASIERHPVPVGVTAITVDAADRSWVARAFAELEQVWGALDGFVNLAGFMTANRLLGDTPDEAFDEIMIGNLRAAFLTSKAALPLLRRGAEPSLVNISSGLAQNVRPGYGPYSAAKAGLIAMTKTLAIENAPVVRANAVAPGAVDTAFLRGGTGRSDETGAVSLNIEAYAATIPLRRIAAVEDIVGPILFLLGSGSRYMTGQVIWVNGGAYMP